MESIRLGNGIIEYYDGGNEEILRELLRREYGGEGIIPSEEGWRDLGIRNFEKTPELAKNPYKTKTSTLLAMSGRVMKLILPRKTGSEKLTEAARFGLGLFNLDEKSVYNGARLDDSGWGKLKGDGIYTKRREKWFKEGVDGVLEGLNRNMTREQAKRCIMLLAKLGHPDYVEELFWMVKGERNQSIEEVEKIIDMTFERGKREYGYTEMMGQFIPQTTTPHGVLKMWAIRGFNKRAESSVEYNPKEDKLRFVFDRIRDAEGDVEEVDKARDYLTKLEGLVKGLPEQIERIRGVLDEGDELKGRLSKAEADYAAILGERDSLQRKLSAAEERLLTPDEIYSVIGEHVPSASKQNVMNALGGLTSKSK